MLKKLQNINVCIIYNINVYEWLAKLFGYMIIPTIKLRLENKHRWWMWDIFAISMFAKYLWSLFNSFF